MATATTTAAGITLPCPHCGESDASVALHLADATFTCNECEAEFSADDVRSIIARWQAVLAWVDAMPRAE